MWYTETTTAVYTVTVHSTHTVLLLLGTRGTDVHVNRQLFCCSRLTFLVDSTALIGCTGLKPQEMTSRVPSVQRGAVDTVLLDTVLLDTNVMLPFQG